MAASDRTDGHGAAGDAGASTGRAGARSVGPLPPAAAFLARLRRIHAAQVDGDSGRARVLLDELKADLKHPAERRPSVEIKERRR